MAGTLNKVLLMGNLTRDPELRYTPGGAAVCEFGLAINRRYVSNNQEREETCFVEVVVWGKPGESCGRYLNKGSMVFVEGRLQYDQWEDRDSGTKRSRLRVVSEQVQFLSRPDGARRDGANDGAEANYSAPPRMAAPGGPKAPYSNQRNMQHDGGPGSYSAPAQAMPPIPDNAFNVSDDIDDDIPF